MAKVDVVVIGAGAAGLTAGALLAKSGKKVLVLDKSEHLGGRGMAVPDEGFKLNVGGHLLEDSGSGITKVFEHLGKRLGHGTVSSDMPVWDHTKDTWGSIRDRYSGNKDELKKVIRALTETPFEEFEKWDDRSLREWMLQHTSDQGVIDLWEFLAVLECLTDEWWDHSASDNLYVRKMHYEEKRIAGYSFWPEQGWDGLFQDLADAVTENGGEIRMGTPAERVIIENHQVKGVAVARQPRILPNEIFEDEIIECDAVVSTLPVWDVLKVVPGMGAAGLVRRPDQVPRPAALQGDVARPLPRLERAGGDPRPQGALDLAPCPAHADARLLLRADRLRPHDGAARHLSLRDGRPSSRARGERDQRYLLEMFEKFEQEIGIMYPVLAKPIWRRRHLVHNPSFGVIQKPGLVGMYRPHWRAPNVDGLYFASETFRSRGIGVDRASRAGLTVVEDILGKKLPGFEETWRY